MSVPGKRAVLGSVLLLLAAWWRLRAETPQPWKLTKDSAALVGDAKLRDEIFDALNAAEKSGTDPRITHFHVKALDGPETTRKDVRFIAFFAQQCGGGASCGDCRDYQLATTDWEHLLVACGQAGDRSVKVTRFADQIVCERNFPEVEAGKIPLAPEELQRLVKSAQEARRGGVTLFTTTRHTGAAALSFSGKVYRAAGADDAAFHYRYPIGGLLQQAMTERDYFLRAIVVTGEEGTWPVVNYRDRQYGYEASSFNHAAGKAPIVLILANGRGQYRMTTFEAALPSAFSTADFMPEALKKFLESHAGK